jgi:hypothetical protein
MMEGLTEAAVTLSQDGLSFGWHFSVEPCERKAEVLMLSDVSGVYHLYGRPPVEQVV